MEKVLSPAPFTPGPARRLSARVALVDITDPARTVLTDCFRQFGIETVPIVANPVERMQKEKFEGCVVRLGPTAHDVIETARSSPANCRIVLYGFGGSAQDAMRLSKFGLNAMFTEPLERQTALKLVRATHLLVLHEFRRYVRIPVVTEVSVTTAENATFTATSQDISSGGMSLRSKQEISPGTNVEVSFALLTLPRIWIRGIVTWRKNIEHSFGIKFDPTDERRVKIKDWIDAYLEN